MILLAYEISTSGESMEALNRKKIITNQAMKIRTGTTGTVNKTMKIRTEKTITLYQAIGIIYQKTIFPVRFS